MVAAEGPLTVWEPPSTHPKLYPTHWARFSVIQWALTRLTPPIPDPPTAPQVICANIRGSILLKERRLATPGVPLTGLSELVTPPPNPTQPSPARLALV